MNLYISVKVNLTRNYLNTGLSNGSIEIVKGIICNDSKPALALSKFILVDFRKSSLEASYVLVMMRKLLVSYLPTRNLALAPSTRKHNRFTDQTCTMLLLKLY